MPERTDITELVQIGPETTAGTAVATTKKLQSLKIELTPNIVTKPIEVLGLRFPAASPLTKEWTTGSIGGEGTYGELIYPLAGILNNATPTTPGGGTNSRLWTFSISSTAPATVKTFTVEQGSFVRAGRAAGVQFISFGMDFTRDEVKVNGALIGAQYTDGIQLTTNATYTLTSAAGPPTAGTFTLTYGGQTTGTIAFGATPAAVQTALEALTNIGVGQVVVTLTTNGPTLSTASSVYTVEFRGTLAQSAQTLTGTFTGLTPASSIALAAGVVGSAPAAIAVTPILPGQVSVYSDPSAASLGTTKLLRVTHASYQFQNMFDAFWVLDAAKPSYAATVDIRPKADVMLSMEADAAGMASLADVRVGTRRFVRIEAVGNFIEGALPYKLTCDFAVEVMSVKFGNAAGVRTVDFTYSMIHDGTWQKAAQIQVQNQQAAL